MWAWDNAVVTLVDNASVVIVTTLGGECQHHQHAPNKPVVRKSVLRFICNARTNCFYKSKILINISEVYWGGVTGAGGCVNEKLIVSS